MRTDHIHKHFYIHTNDKGKNFRLIRVNDQHPSPKNYEEIIPHSNEKYLLDTDLYDNYLIIRIREKGLSQIHLMTYDFKRYPPIKFKDPTYSASTIFSCHDDDGVFISYSSLATPSTVYRYTFKAKKMKVVEGSEKFHLAMMRRNMLAKGSLLHLAMAKLKYQYPLSIKKAYSNKMEPIRFSYTVTARTEYQ